MSGANSILMLAHEGLWSASWKRSCCRCTCVVEHCAPQNIIITLMWGDGKAAARTCLSVLWSASAMRSISSTVGKIDMTSAGASGSAT